MACRTPARPPARLPARLPACPPARLPACHTKGHRKRKMSVLKKLRRSDGLSRLARPPAHGHPPAPLSPPLPNFLHRASRLSPLASCLLPLLSALPSALALALALALAATRARTQAYQCILGD